MENPLKNIGLRNFLIKIIVFVVIGLATAAFISIFFRFTPIFKQYLEIPAVFQLEPPNFRTTIINSALFGILAFVLVSQKKLYDIKSIPFKKSQIAFGILAVIFLIEQYVFKFLINQNVDFFLQAPIFWGIIKILINVCFVIALALAVFGLEFTIYFIKMFKKELIYFSAFSIGFYFVIVLFQNLWLYFSTFISNTLYFLLSRFYSNVTLSLNTNPNGPMLGLNNFIVVIGKPCSGIDSLLLFSSFFTLAYVLDRKKLNWPVAIAFFIVGLIGMFITNIVRLFLLMLMGIYISPTFATGLFHTNIGWILFMGYGLLFWLIAVKFIYKKEAKLNKEK